MTYTVEQYCYDLDFLSKQIDQKNLVVGYFSEAHLCQWDLLSDSQLLSGFCYRGQFVSPLWVAARATVFGIYAPFDYLLGRAERAAEFDAKILTFKVDVTKMGPIGPLEKINPHFPCISIMDFLFHRSSVYNYGRAIRLINEYQQVRNTLKHISSIGHPAPINFGFYAVQLALSGLPELLNAITMLETDLVLDDFIKVGDYYTNVHWLVPGPTYGIKILTPKEVLYGPLAKVLLMYEGDITPASLTPLYAALGSQVVKNFFNARKKYHEGMRNLKASLERDQNIREGFTDLKKSLSGICEYQPIPVLHQVSALLLSYQKVHRWIRAIFSVPLNDSSEPFIVHLLKTNLNAHLTRYDDYRLTCLKLALGLSNGKLSPENQLFITRFVIQLLQDDIFYHNRVNLNCSSRLIKRSEGIQVDACLALLERYGSELLEKLLYGDQNEVGVQHILTNEQLKIISKSHSEYLLVEKENMLRVLSNVIGILEGFGFEDKDADAMTLEQLTSLPNSELQSQPPVMSYSFIGGYFNPDKTSELYISGKESWNRAKPSQ